MATEPEVPLPGGAMTHGVVRVGDTVRRPQCENAAFVHALLEHLEAVGFIEAPRFFGVDDRGREILTFVEGWVPEDPDPSAWSEGQVVAAAKLLRRYHDASASAPGRANHEIVCHGDPTPGNLAWNSGIPTGLFDFDNAYPGERIDDVAYFGWLFVLNGHDSNGLGIDEQARRLRLICDAYWFDRRTELLDAIVRRQTETAALILETARRTDCKRTPAETESAVVWVAEETAWLHRPAESLGRHLS